jgi:hypothetical protein
MMLRDDEIELYQTLRERFRAWGAIDPDGAARRWILHQRARRHAERVHVNR